jgi:excisionase family DNA binding protein
VEGRCVVLTVQQAAGRLGVSRSLVYALCAAGVVAHTRHGRSGKRGCIRIEEAALEAYRLSCRGERRPTAAPPPLQHITAG